MRLLTDRTRHLLHHLTVPNERGSVMLPIAFDLTAKAARDADTSALPNAPVLPDPPPRRPRLRVALAAFLRATARRQVRLADWLEPDAHATEPLPTRV
jgi:hypothetical protein